MRRIVPAERDLSGLPRCLDDLRLPSDALAPNAAAVWSYHGIARQLVLMLKYSGIAECAQVLADGMASACPFALPPDTVVTSVPMTKKHLDARGIDHGRLLAEAFAQRRNLPCQPLLIRTRETATQQGLNAAQRRKTCTARLPPPRAFRPQFC